MRTARSSLGRCLDGVLLSSDSSPGELGSPFVEGLRETFDVPGSPGFGADGDDGLVLADRLDDGAGDALGGPASVAIEGDGRFLGRAAGSFVVAG